MKRNLIIMFIVFCCLINSNSLLSQNADITAKELKLLLIKEEKIVSIFCQIDKQLIKSRNPKRWPIGDVVVAQIGDSLYIQVTAIRENSELFFDSNDHQVPYGYIVYNNRLFYISSFDKYDMSGVESLFIVTKKTKIVKKKDPAFYAVEGNPVWLYLYSKGKIKIIKSVNLEML